MKNAILDTFIIKDSEIFLKPFHIARTFESYSFLNKAVAKHEVEAVYQTLEAELSRSLQPTELARVIFSPNSISSSL